MSFQLKKIQIWFVWVNDRNECWRNSRLISKKSAVEMLICMKLMIKKNAGRVFVWSKKINYWNDDDKKNQLIKKMLTKFYRTELTVNFDAYKIIFIHNFSSVMFVFFIIVFWFFLDFVKITIFFKIDDNQYFTKTMMKHVVIVFRN